MTAKDQVPSTAKVDDLADRLDQVADQASCPGEATELLDEVSQLLWLVSSLDPDAEKLLRQSSYVLSPLNDAEHADGPIADPDAQ